MFEIADTPQRFGSGRCLVDEGRDAWLIPLAPVRSEPSSPPVPRFRFRWLGNDVGFITDRTFLKDAGDDYIKLDIGTLRTIEQGVPSRTPFEFASDAQQARTMLLITEALLAFGNDFNGSEWPDGSLRIVDYATSPPTTYRRTDFGF